MERTKSTMRKLLLMCMLALNLLAAPAFAQAETLDNQLTTNVEKLLSNLAKNDDSMGIHTGISIYNLTKKEYLYQHNQQKGYVPASNMKLFVTVASLESLGPDYQYKTEVYLNGTVNPNGVVNGDLVLKGYGDPSLSVEDLQSMVEALKEKGIKQVNGNLLVDESYFDTVRLGPGWMWDDEAFGYSAQLSALALHKNNITVTVTPDKEIGKAPTLTMTPSTAYISLSNQLQTVEGEEDDVSVDRPRSTNTLTFSGTIGKEAEPYEEDVTMEEPALFVADIWKQQLEEGGILLKPNVQSQKVQLKIGVPLYTHHSKPLQELLVELNKASDNFYAEMLLKTLGATQKGEGSFESGVEVSASVLKDAGIDVGFKQVDGSGLSRYDLVTTEQMVKLLSFVQEQEYKDVFESTLPIAGVDGTLKTRMIGTPAEKNLFAKTGSMGGVNCLSGYVTAKNGDKLAFSILINGIYKSKYARELQDNLGIAMATYPENTLPIDYIPEIKKTYKLSKTLDPILNQAKINGVTSGVIVNSLEEDESDAVWYERDADRLLTPASNLKLLTSAAGLQQLGEEYRFKTEVYTTAPIPDNGIVKGDLLVKGFGDPTIHTEDSLKVQEGVSVEEIVATLREKGVKQIHGNLIMDDSYFDEQRLGLGWAWDDESYYYNALISALSLNRGTVKLDYQPGPKAGDPVQLTLSPKTSYVQLINEAKTVAANEEKTFSIVRDRAKNVIRISGNLPAGTEGDYERVPVEQPALYFGTVLQEKLSEQGIKLEGKGSVLLGRIGNEIKVAEFSSEPLTDVVTYLNKKSDNLYAEMILKTLGAVKGEEGSTSAGVEGVLEMITAMGGKTNFDMVDGSGLTRYNLISPRHIEFVLEGMSKQPQFTSYYNSLPVAGVDGTLKNRMAGTAAENNVHAKTGTMQGVSSLSGYLTTKDGEKLAFSIVLNGYTTDADDLTDIQDQIAVALANYQE